MLSYYAAIPPSLDFPGAAALPAAVETATRALDQLSVGNGSRLLVNGASGSVGSAAVQLAVTQLPVFINCGRCCGGAGCLLLECVANRGFPRIVHSRTVPLHHDLLLLLRAQQR